MNLFLNILLSVLVVILGVFPNLFVVIDASQKVWYNRLTVYGICLVFLMIAVIIFTTISEIRKERESKLAQKTLNDINESLSQSNVQYDSLIKDIDDALKKNKLQYNSANKSIVNYGTITDISHGNQMFHFGANSDLTGLKAVGNTMNETPIFDTGDFEDALRDFVKQTGLVDKEAQFIVFEGTGGDTLFRPVNKVLVKNGYTVSQRYSPPLPQYGTKGINSSHKDGKLLIYAGNP